MRQSNENYGAVPAMTAGPQTVPQGLTAVAMVFVLLAFIPMLGQADPTSTAVSPSRLVELLLLSMAAGCGVLLRGRNGRVELPVSVSCLIALITAFSLWAMVTSLQGPLLLTGLVKALELLVICFVAFEIVCATRPTEPGDPGRLANVALLSILCSVAVLIVLNVIQQHRPLPLAGVADWPSTYSRPRLMLGQLHPLTSGLLLALGVIFCLYARMPWWFRLVSLVGLAWLLRLCDARGSEFGLWVGLLLSLFSKLPSSPYKLLAGLSALCTTVFAGLIVTLSGAADKLILRYVGSDAFTLNGRVGLWSYVLSQVPDHPLLGVGYYSTRSYVLNAFPFAGHTHNSGIEVLFSTGVVGAGLFILFLCLWVFALVTTADPMLVGISPIVLIEGSLNPILFTPSIGMFLMLLVLLNALFGGYHRSQRGVRLMNAPVRLLRPLPVR